MFRSFVLGYCLGFRNQDLEFPLHGLGFRIVRCGGKLIHAHIALRSSLEAMVR